MWAYVRTAGLVVIVFLILAMLSKMSTPELRMDVGLQQSVKKLITKSQEAQARAEQATNPVHFLLNTNQAMNYLDSALALCSAKNCTTLAGFNVQDNYTAIMQQQENAALRLHYALQQPPPAALPQHQQHHQPAALPQHQQHHQPMFQRPDHFRARPQ